MVAQAKPAEGRMPKALLVSVVEDDRFFRESMKRLMRSLGYTVEAFSSAADLLASPRLVETACLIADVHMSSMTGVELHKHLIEMGSPFRQSSLLPTPMTLTGRAP